MQRAVGNQATVEALKVQRSVLIPVKNQKKTWKLGKPLRVSDDGRMAVVDSAVFEGEKEFYATPPVIVAAQDKLGAVGSPFTLTVRSQERLRGVVPGTATKKSLGTPIELVRAAPTDMRKAGAQASEDMTTLEGCNANAQDVMGLGITQKDYNKGNNKLVVDVNGTEVETFGGHDVDAKNALLVEAAKAHLKRDHVTTADAKITWQGLTKAERDRYAKRFGFNQFASPEVGDAMEAIRGVGNPKAGTFPMHFAPVVAKSGPDYVTMENWGKAAHQRKPGDTGEASKAWFFRMYGEEKADEDQSYYGQHAAEGSLGDEEELLGVRHQAVPKG